MTDVERYHDEAPPSTLSPVSASELDVYVRQAELLAQSDIIPTAYRKKPANIIVAALTGRAFGWDALTALRNGHVIEGTWSIKPEAMLALVRRSGHSVTGEATPDGATVHGKRCDTGDEMTVSFTMDDGRRAGLTNKSVWKSYPQSMCWARAVSQLCRMLFADVTLGLSYTPEEMGASVGPDGDVIDAQEVDPRPPHFISAENVAVMRVKCDEAGVPVEEVVLRATDGRTDDPAQVLVSEVRAARDALEAVKAEWAVGEADRDIPEATQ